MSYFLYVAFSPGQALNLSGGPFKLNYTVSVIPVSCRATLLPFLLPPQLCWSSAMTQFVSEPANPGVGKGIP